MRTDSPLPRARGAEHVIDAVQARDAGLRLARRAQRWIVAVAVGTAGGLAALTAHAYHARAAPSTVTTASPAQRSVDDSGRHARGRRFPPPRSSLPRPRRPPPPPRTSHRWCPAGPERAMVVAAAPSSYWFITRATGAVALVLLSGSVALGVASVRRMELANRRFVVEALHRSVSLLAVVFVAAPRGHDAARRLRAHRRPGCRDPVSLRLSTRLAGARDGRLRPGGGGDDHEPHPSPRRLSRVARDPLAGLRQLAARPCPQLRDRD